MHGLAQAGRRDLHAGGGDILHRHFQGQAGNRNRKLAAGPDQHEIAFRRGQHSHALVVPGHHGAF